ncbi:hypothetical protein L1280_000342 [Deinococcus sp. HSC-46F16]|uniref:hypothetical protein n=1 Tax=Deinococcus sp. HSC-46F16 TaxID=2910968 RepID=UPI0020A00360|nr:hypothetical protein [Deinococcus sp. HSC-46F16]MCP2013214.1 hypothetical protein [Deinococcus sp. HSC-46F16]
MRSLFCLALLSLSTAEAATVPLRSLLASGSNVVGSLRVDEDVFYVERKTGEGRNLTLAVGQAQLARAGRVSAVRVLAMREYLTPGERSIFTKMVLDTALKCFNLRSERKAAITTWLNRQNASSIRDVAQNFGPMNLRFTRDISDDGRYYTYVEMRRTGTPGVAPWINYCTP